VDLSAVENASKQKATAFSSEVGTGPRGENASKKRLELRFRSSHDIAATSDANFGIKGALATY
jgi:hypothetical protein